MGSERCDDLGYRRLTDAQTARGGGERARLHSQYEIRTQSVTPTLSLMSDMMNHDQ
jgi:hypothetical protein